MTARKNRVLVKLDLPTNVGALLIYARRIVDAMTDNPWFPNPTPPLAKVTAAIAALSDAETARLSGTRGTATVRNEKQTALEKLLRLLEAHVQGVADDNEEHAPAIIESSAMSIRKESVAQKPPISVKPGKKKGTVVIRVRAAAKDAHYDWQWSADRGTTWNVAPSTKQADTVIEGLPSVVECLFRYRWVTRKTRSDWCEPVACVVP